MDFLKQWRRRAFGAAGATVIAPAAIVLAALAVGVAGGGIKGLGSLSQALTGPQLPVATAAERAGERQRKTGESSSELLVAAAGALQARETRRKSNADNPSRDGGSGSDGNGNSGGDGNSGSGGGGGSNNGASNPTPQPTPSSQPTPEPNPSTIRETGDTVKETVKPVPVVGETGAAVIEQIVTTADGVCADLPVCPQPLP